MRRTTGNAALVCGGAAVILAMIAMLWMMLPSDKSNAGISTDLTIGTYGENVYLYSFDHQSLEFTLESKGTAKNASYALSCRNDRNNIVTYAVCESGEHSGVSSLLSKRRLLNRKKAASMKMTADREETGADPCFMMLYDDGKYLFTADYSGGTVSVFPIEDGVIGECMDKLEFEGSGPVKGRQESSHMHQIRQIPSIENFGNQWLLASDLGCDVLRLIFVSRVDSYANGESIMPVHIQDFPCPSGSGPRHMEFSKDGRTLYCLAELSGEILVYDIYEKDGQPTLELKQRIQADEVNAGGSADIHLHPSGKWLYTSHRLDNDGIAIFSTGEEGVLEKIGYAKTARHPRNFMITDDGAYLLAACRDDRLIQVFSIDEKGSLTLTPSVLEFDSDRPSSILAY
jgi:6-phosphogluconolactonase (cycloisomerase 2 family)